MNKKDVNTVDKLQIYLQEKTMQSDRLYHYTTYESLISILKNKSFRLSRVDLLNDRAEQKLSGLDKLHKKYIMSFTREKEYVSMWAMYGKPSGIKIRLDFSRQKLYEAIKNNFFKDPQLKQKIDLYTTEKAGIFSKKDFVISDVVYIDKDNKELRHNEKAFLNIWAEQYIVDSMSGFIKYDVWEFERETRLRVEIFDSESENTSEKQYYIYAGINEELIKDFHITFNPWMSAEMKAELQKSLNLLAGIKLSYDSSKHDGEITEF